MNATPVARNSWKCDAVRPAVAATTGLFVPEQYFLLRHFSFLVLLTQLFQA
jgi:hypothetical protein